MSIGYGRLHLMTSAFWLANLGIKIDLICGWVPRNPSGMLVRLCSWLVRRDLSFGMRKRMISIPNVSVKSMPTAEFVQQGVSWIIRRLGGPDVINSAWVWSVFGVFSRRYIAGTRIFHCRSGAGQGGAIRMAKANGMKIIVDHSALHPAATERNLRDDYRRWGQEVVIAPGMGVWENVEKDCRAADVILVNAQHIRDSFIAQGYSPAKLRVVHLGVRADFAGLKQDYEISETIHILYTGAFSILKGAEYLLEAVRLLGERNHRVRLDVVGSVAIPAALKMRYLKYDIAYHGVIPQDDLKRYLSRADVYIFPSLADGCAQSGMEALAAGVPVVATYQSGLPISDGENGIVVPMKNANAIVDKVEMLINDKELRATIGRAAAKMMAEHYTWERYAENVVNVYKEVLGV